MGWNISECIRDVGEEYTERSGKYISATATRRYSKLAVCLGFFLKDEIA